MTRRRSPFSILASFPVAALLALVLFLVPGAAWAKYAPPPPPAPDKHVVTTVGWLAPVDVRKLDEECEIVKFQTGFVIDVLLADNSDDIGAVADTTFNAWKPGDSKKDNGILLVIQPNFPKGERKARIQVGKGVQGVLTEVKAGEIMRTVMGPRLNGMSEIREAVAEGVRAIGEALGAKLSEPTSDAGTAADGGAASAAAGRSDVHAEDSPGNPVLTALGAFVAIVLAYVAFMWFRGSRQKG